MSRNFASFIHVCNILPCCFSDHNYVNLTLVLNTNFSCGNLIILCFKILNFVVLFLIVFLTSLAVLSFSHLLKSGGIFSSAIYSLKLFLFLVINVNLCVVNVLF